MGESKSKRYNQIISETDAVYHEIALRFCLPDSVMMVLYTLADCGGTCLISDLTGMGMSKQTVNSALRRLEHDGVLTLASAGGRSKCLHLTTHGRALCAQTVEKVIALENEIFSSWTAEEWEQYLTLSSRFLCGLKERTAELR